MMNKESKYINVKGQLMDLSEPRVMGILNVTPDSFYSESRLQTVEKIAADTERDYYMSAEEAKAYGLIDDVIIRKDTKKEESK